MKKDSRRLLPTKMKATNSRKEIDKIKSVKHCKMYRTSLQSNLSKKNDSEQMSILSSNIMYIAIGW